MNKLIIFLMLVISINFISATTIYSGETQNITLDKEYVYYSIIGNSTPVNLIISQEGNTLYITPDKYSPSDNFTIIFFDKEKEIQRVYFGGRGGGTRTIYEEKNVTEYIKVPVKEIEYVDKEIEVEVEKEFIPTWVFIVFGLFALIIIYAWIKSRKKEEVVYTQNTGGNGNDI